MTLHVTSAANEDVLAIWLYMSAFSVGAANRMVDDIQARYSRLLEYPEIGRDRSDLEAGLRSVTVGLYAVYYRIRESVIEIVRVLHGARDLDAIFHQ